ncbi:MAG: PQQ-dependent sugar dehydrogenase, partial [Thermoleophilaceae bacterium]
VVPLLFCALLAAACAPGPVSTPTSPAASFGPDATGSPAASAAPTPVPKVPTLADIPVQTGLALPWDLAFAPDGRLFVTERPGNVLIFASGAPNAPRLGHMSIPNMRAVGESGLMGIALDPDFAANGLVYLCASRVDEGEWRNQVLRYREAANDLAFDGYVIRSGMRAATIHNGCTLRFGPDRKLWVSMGENGSGRLAQDPNSLHGKFLRVNGDGSIPDDNPILPGARDRSAAYSFGHRNPQGLAFQPGTGQPFGVEHGADVHDEINLLRAGANYGWPTIEGPGGGFTDPLWSSGRLTLATSGATFVTGQSWGTWAGSLFVATLKESDLRRFAVNGTEVVPAEVLLDRKYGRLRTPVQGPDGALYVTTSNGTGDRIVRITASQ